mgnify:FL=1
MVWGECVNFVVRTCGGAKALALADRLYLIKPFNMKTLTNLFLCLAIVASALSAQAKPNKNKIAKNAAFETELKAAIDSMNVVGLSIAVVKDNKIVYNNSYGVQDLETKVPCTNNTMYRIASISKSFSGVAIMQLVEKGKLKLDTDINDILDFVVRNPKYPDVPITVEMLLSHTSSLNDSEGYWVDLNCIIPGKNPNYTKAYNDYKPGTGYEYCNLGFSLLGSIIERVSGERFDLYAQRHIIEPLGLVASFNINEVPAKRIAKLYSWDGTKYNEENAYRPVNDLASYQLGVNSVTFSPAGGMKISAKELAKYMMMHMNYGKSPLAKERILTEESARCMQREHAVGHSYGVALEQTERFTRGEVMVGHTGGAYGLCSAMFFNPEQKHGLVMMCSGCNDASHVLNRIMPIMYKHFLKK